MSNHRQATKHLQEERREHGQPDEGEQHAGRGGSSSAGDGRLGGRGSRRGRRRGVVFDGLGGLEAVDDELHGVVGVVAKVGAVNGRGAVAAGAGPVVLVAPGRDVGGVGVAGGGVETGEELRERVSS